MWLRNSDLMAVQLPEGGEEGHDCPTPAAFTYSPAELELQPLLELVHAAPEVRTELLDEVRQRIAQGVYETEEAARITAQALRECPD